MNQTQKTREELEAEGYRFAGEAKCRGCGAAIVWFMTPAKKRAPFQWARSNPSKLESHWATCPEAQEFRKPRMGKTPKKQT